MKRQRWASKAVHKFSFLLYPDGDNTFVVQTRDSATVGIEVLRVAGVPDINGPGIYKHDGQAWHLDRALGEPRSLTKSTDGDLTVATDTVLAALRSLGSPARSTPFVAECVLRGMSRRTAIRHIARLTACGMLQRDQLGAQHVTYSLTRKTN